MVEDHHALREAMVSTLTEAGFNVQGAMSAEELDVSAFEAPPEIYILDLNLPGEDGLSLAERLRELQPNCGIIMLTARNLKQDRIRGYKSGADVYLMKPTDLDELLAAVESLSERVGRVALGPAFDTQPSGLQLFLERREIVGPEGREGLSKREVLILSALARNRLRHVENWELIEIIGESSESYQKSALEVAITRLRQKLVRIGCEESTITALRGRGYLFNALIQIL